MKVIINEKGRAAALFVFNAQVCRFVVLFLSTEHGGSMICKNRKKMITCAWKPYSLKLWEKT